MFAVFGLMVAACIGVPSDPQGPPIFNPGAPGAASRTITAAEAVELSRTGFVEADVRFMQHMLVHHAQAVTMVALMPTRTASGPVTRMGSRIAASQSAEIELMQDWLTSRGQPLSPDAHAGHHAHASMPDTPAMAGMLTNAQMAALGEASGPEFERLFLQGMIQHHQGAIAMVDALNADPDAAEDPLLSDFATSVVADQSAEILRMQTLLAELPMPSNPQEQPR